LPGESAEAGGTVEAGNAGKQRIAIKRKGRILQDASKGAFNTGRG